MYRIDEMLEIGRIQRLSRDLCDRWEYSFGFRTAYVLTEYYASCGDERVFVRQEDLIFDGNSDTGLHTDEDPWF